MVSVSFENIFSIGGDLKIEKADFDAFAKELPRHFEQLLLRGRGFLDLPKEESLVSRIYEYADAVADDFEDVVVLGIGGSALGMRCLQTCFSDSLLRKIYVLDNVDPFLIRQLEKQIDLKRTLFVVVSKSGETVETLAQYFYFRDLLLKQGFSEQKQFVFVTDSDLGLLRKISLEKGIKVFEVPKNVGGRFSVLSAAGMLPAALAGIEISKVLSGGLKALDVVTSRDFEVNLAYQIALMQYLLYQKGACMNVLMPYLEQLSGFGDWYRQLLAESIGKKFNRRGEEVNVGITPVLARGVSDQHSQTQLYFEGPFDKLFFIFKQRRFAHDLAIPKSEDDILNIGGRSFGELLNIECDATVKSLLQNNRPMALFEFEELDEEVIGFLFVLMEGAVAYLAELFEINAFDQPAVELTKSLTREMLDRA